MSVPSPDDVLVSTLAAATAAGMSAAGDWVRPGLYEGALGKGRRRFYRIDLRCGVRAVDLNVRPLEGHRLVGHWPGVPLDAFGPAPDYDRVPDRSFLETALEEFESLLRGALVASGDLPRREFPTDASLRAWQSRSPAGTPARYSRRAALAAAAAAAATRRRPGLTDAEYGAAVSAHSVVEGRLERALACVRTESHVGFLLPRGAGKDRKAPAATEEADADAPRGP